MQQCFPHFCKPLIAAGDVGRRNQQGRTYVPLRSGAMGAVIHEQPALAVSLCHGVEAMIAVGRPGKKEDLPPALQEREFPSDRKKREEIVFEGGFVK